MGQDDLNMAGAHAVLVAVAGNSMGKLNGKNYVHPGMHANYLIHGILGVFTNQSSIFNFYDFTAAYGISLKASKYLALPCLMADLNRSDKTISAIHVLSGVVPFALAVSGKEDPKLANVVLGGNILALIYYAHKKNKDWAWYSAGAAFLAYFAGPKSGQKMAYPLTLALFEYCAHRLSQCFNV